MKKIAFLLTCLLFYSYAEAQTTETFETESVASTSFTDNGQVFNITSQAPALFDIYVLSNGGWNGGAPDNRFIDNSGSSFFNTPVQFTISSQNSASFTLKSIYLYLATSAFNLNVSGSVTITGRLGGVTQFTVTRNSPFNTSSGTNNGFTFFDLATLGGQNNAGTSIDQYTITTTGNIAYVAMDAMKWQQACAQVTVTQASQTNVSCNGGSNGSATVSASGGTGLTYNWTPGNPPGDGTATVTGLTAGNWTCTVTNACGNTNSTTFTITAPAALTATQSQTNTTCSNGSNGTATVNVSGGTGTYFYSWAPSGGSGATASNLAPGNYTVTITDSNSCSIQRNFTITAPPALTATQSQTNTTCSYSSNGTAMVNVSGGTGTYSYSWAPSGGTAATASNLAPGSYTVTITDGNNCSIQRSFNITSPPALTATQSQTNNNCGTGNSGSATVNVSGGTGTYTYSWAPSGGNAATASNLAAGNYTVTITDSNNCSIQRSFTITAPPALTATQSQTNVSCNGGNDGTATVTVSGGTGTYTYAWFPSGGNGPVATGLQAGFYIVFITDANGCSIQKQFTIGTATECSIATIWNGTSWSNGTPVCNNFAVTINGDYNSLLHGEITACSLTVNSGNVVVGNGDNFIIKGIVTVTGGTLTFEQNSNLVQADNVANSGIITYKRNSSLLYGLDYTMWSSPVSGSQTLKQFSPQTLDNRFYVYNTALNAYSNYLSASGVFGGNPAVETFDIARGYLIRMPDGLDANTQSVFNGIFTGTPNNGAINIALNTQNNRFNAVGNPYPSPINIQAFLTVNQSSLDDGTLYFWRKTNNSTATSYATVTMAAYVANTAAGGDTSGGAFSAGQESEWVVNPGQGFIVKASATATSLSFTNAMRRAVNNNQFFRTDANSLPPVTNAASKLWLDITSAANDFGQTAVVYSDVTTTGLDYGYDGVLVNDGALSVYSVAQNTNLAIQARAGFNVSDEVTLGYKTTATGTYTIAISQLTGVFTAGQHIYLKDNILGIRHNLTTGGPYEFESNEGTFNNRFVIVYQDVLGIARPEFTKNSISISQSKNVITVGSSSSELKSVVVYDTLGRMVYSLDEIHSHSTQITNLTAQEQVLIVQVTTTDGNKVSKKIIY